MNSLQHITQSEYYTLQGSPHPAYREPCEKVSSQAKLIQVFPNLLKKCVTWLKRYSTRYAE